METNESEQGRRIARWMGPTRVREASMAECHQGEDAAYGTTRIAWAWSACARRSASRMSGNGGYRRTKSGRAFLQCGQKDMDQDDWAKASRPSASASRVSEKYRAPQVLVWEAN